MRGMTTSRMARLNLAPRLINSSTSSTRERLVTAYPTAPRMWSPRSHIDGSSSTIRIFARITHCIGRPAAEITLEAIACQNGKLWVFRKTRSYQRQPAEVKRRSVRRSDSFGVGAVGTEAGERSGRGRGVRLHNRSVVGL